MTSRQLYEGVLIELNKSNAPNIMLEDFNYFANRAVNLYVNKKYNIYDVNQQTTDDLRVLKASALLTPTRVDKYDALSLANMATYEVILPPDYLHLLNCIVIYNVLKTYKCYNAGDTWRVAATRLTADAYSKVLDNFWFKPTYKRPYYYINNINSYNTVPTNPETDPSINTDDDVKDGNNKLIGMGSDNPKTISIRNAQEGLGTEISSVERGANIRYGNVSRVRLEIRYGTDNSVFTLDEIPEKEGGKIYIDYIKVPQHIRLTQKQLDFTEDKSQILEFPDYVCQEILNELVHIIMENISDLRLQTHPVVSLSIANPAQALTQAEGQSA